MATEIAPSSSPTACRPEASAWGDSIWQPVQGWYLPLKHACDFLLALGMALVCGPVILLGALLVKLTSRGPAFYTQTRVGRFGKPFTIYKLRSMTHNCEHASGAQWSVPGDPRVTPVGRFLRWSKIDELPQLWNVLRGDMCLVGPRPERPEFIPKLEKVIPHYQDRLLVRPGITGLAQVQLPPDTDMASVRRKLSYDLYYVRYLNPWLDLCILLCTPLWVCGVSREWLTRLFLVPRPEVVRHTYESATSPSHTPSHLQTVLAQS